jgi:hypothetical protein
MMPAKEHARQLCRALEPAALQSRLLHGGYNKFARRLCGAIREVMNHFFTSLILMRLQVM